MGNGEPYGLYNVKLARKNGRLGEIKKDNCEVGNPCMEITLANYESCNLAELYLNNITSKKQLIDCSKLLYKTQKAICAMNFLHEETNKIVHKNMRIGQGITGVCQSLDKLVWLDEAYKELKAYDIVWSKERGWNESIKLTTVKPSGTLSLLGGSTPGVHPAFSKYYIRRVRMASDDKLISLCKDAGYHVESALGFDGSIDHKTSIVSFPCYAGEEAIVAKDMTAIKQLELVKKMQTIWADNAVSVTVYYKKEELPEIKTWLKENYQNSVKSVSFLLHSEHGFKQAPYEEITKEQYEALSKNITPITGVVSGDNVADECLGGMCPIK
jgi:ribonucleotide reductase alpha subunit